LKIWKLVNFAGVRGYGKLEHQLENKGINAKIAEKVKLKSMIE
jgi:hypothetical protein